MLASSLNSLTITTLNESEPDNWTITIYFEMFEE